MESQKRKTVGIVCDNYKVEKFISTIKKAGFEEVLVKKFTKGTTLLQILVENDSEKIKEVYQIYREVEMHFKFGN
jgi:hypothetical protein